MRRLLRAGVNLVEALVAVFILSLAVLFVIQVFPLGVAGSRQHRNYLMAATIARNLLEDARLTSFSSLTGTKGSQTIKEELDEQTSTGTFEYVLNVQSVSADKKRVWAEVSWQEGGQTRQFVAETVIVDPLGSI